MAVAGALLNLHFRCPFPLNSDFSFVASQVGEEGLIPKEYLGCVKEMRGKISACKARIGALDNVEKGLREAASSDDWSAPGLAGALASLAKCEPIIEGGWKPEVEALPEGKSKADKEAERKASKDVKQAEKEAKDAECEKARKVRTEQRENTREEKACQNTLWLFHGVQAKEDERARKQMERDQARRAKRDSEEQKKKGIEKQQVWLASFFLPVILKSCSELRERTLADADGDEAFLRPHWEPEERPKRPWRSDRSEQRGERKGHLPYHGGSPLGNYAPASDKGSVGRGQVEMAGQQAKAEGAALARARTNVPGGCR